MCFLNIVLSVRKNQRSQNRKRKSRCKHIEAYTEDHEIKKKEKKKGRKDHIDNLSYPQRLVFHFVVAMNCHRSGKYFAISKNSVLLLSYVHQISASLGLWVHATLTAAGSC